MISSLRLQNFRSYKDSSFEFDPGINIVVGPNASGKTNLLEAILVLAVGRSYRTRDLELVRRRASWLRLDAYFDNGPRTLKLKLTDESADKVFEINDQPFKRLNLERTVPVVLFEPNHLQLASRGPEQRRLYFDDILERSEAGFKSLAAHYRRTLAQRNALLKQSPAAARRQLFAWDVRLSELGGQLAGSRQQLMTDINKSLSRTYSQIAGKRTRVKLEYISDFSLDRYSSSMLKKLTASAGADFRRGFTGHGPHREDIAIKLNDQPAGAVASRGEIRSLLLALKIYELKLLENQRQQKPILLLDDVFSELDGSRRRHLVDYLKDYQTIITTTDADAVLEYFSESHNLALPKTQS